MDKYGLIGYPLGHSFSIGYFNEKFENEGINATYENFEIPSIDGLPEILDSNPNLRDMFDIKIFVETDADVRILRRALRDVEERGRTLQSVVDQYLTTVKPMHEQYVEPSRKYADIVVLEGGHNLVALEMIMQRIQSHIDET